MQHLVNDCCLDFPAVSLPCALELPAAQIHRAAAHRAEGQDSVPPAGGVLRTVEEEHELQVTLRRGFQLPQALLERDPARILELSKQRSAFRMGEPVGGRGQGTLRGIPRGGITDLHLRPFTG